MADGVRCCGKVAAFGTNHEAARARDVGGKGASQRRCPLACQLVDLRKDGFGTALTSSRGSVTPLDLIVPSAAGVQRWGGRVRQPWPFVKPH